MNVTKSIFQNGQGFGIFGAKKKSRRITELFSFLFIENKKHCLDRAT